MKTLILYYSLTGNTKKSALAAADEKQCDVVQVTDERKPGMFKALAVGCFYALSGKGWKINPIEADIEAYEHIIVYTPIWAGNPPPAVNAVFNRLPSGKTISAVMVSETGKSNCTKRLIKKITDSGCIPGDFINVKA